MEIIENCNCNSTNKNLTINKSLIIYSINSIRKSNDIINLKYSFNVIVNEYDKIRNISMINETMPIDCFFKTLSNEMGFKKNVFEDILNLPLKDIIILISLILNI